MWTAHEIYMHRCLQLARLGAGIVAPNPMVGSVLVHTNKIMGEGYHRVYGGAHAEVDCINSVKGENEALISQSTLYVSLEPCAHFGKTPPCTDLIIKNKIGKVVVGCRDPFFQVNGKGIEKLQAAGVEVIIAVLEEECKDLNKRFFIFHKERRPYIILKWAETGDGKIALPSNSRSVGEPRSQTSEAITNKGRVKVEVSAKMDSPIGRGREEASRLSISNEQTNRLVHKWRSEEMAILVGTNTAFLDDPYLTTRLWPGRDPIRMVIDMHLQLPESLHLFDGKTPTIVFNLHKHTLPLEKISSTDSESSSVGYYQVTEDVSLVHQIVNALHYLNIQSVIVEGGAQLLQSFIDDGSWDEARVITNEHLIIANGLAAPVLRNHKLVSTQNILTDIVRFYNQTTNNA